MGKQNPIRQGLAVAVILLFISVTIAPTNTALIEDVKTENIYQKKTVLFGFMWGKYQYTDVFNQMLMIGCNPGDIKVIGIIINSDLTYFENDFSAVMAINPLFLGYIKDGNLAGFVIMCSLLAY